MLDNLGIVNLVPAGVQNGPPRMRFYLKVPKDGEQVIVWFLSDRLVLFDEVVDELL